MERIKGLQDKGLVMVFFICCLQMVNSQVNFSAPCNGVQIMADPLYNPSASIRQVSGMFARTEFNVNDSKPGGRPATFEASFYPLVFTVDLSPDSENEVEIKSVQLSNSSNIQEMDFLVIKQNNSSTSPTFLATSRLAGDDPIAHLAAGTTGKAVKISVIPANKTKPVSFDIDIRACLAGLGVCWGVCLV
ncbi:hypothetical protein SNE40_023511 [Patella caerulea]|uniref:Uncharacterized protein n=1 Tax=Patella caerulea TaxID=87958 RepID=A0AAN8IYR8_PATCE